MDSRDSFVLDDGTVINDEYATKAVKDFDEALRLGKIVFEPNPHYQKPLRARFSTMPRHLQKELEPFILNTDA